MSAMYIYRLIISGLVFLGMTSRVLNEHVFSIIDEIDCPEGGDELLEYAYKVPYGIMDRALKTAPPQISIRTSSIPKAGLGAFARTFLKKHTWLGEYEGLLIRPAEAHDSDATYMFTVGRAGEEHHHVDAKHLATSSWVRYVNGARNSAERNVVAKTCYDKVFYKLSRDVAPGTELLVYYGKAYTAQYLGVDAPDLESSCQL